MRRARADHTIFANHRVAFNDNAGMNHTVAADLALGADVCMRWINKRNASEH